MTIPFAPWKETPETPGLPSAIDPTKVGVATPAPASTAARDTVFSIEKLTASYGSSPAVRT